MKNPAYNLVYHGTKTPNVFRVLRIIQDFQYQPYKGIWTLQDSEESATGNDGGDLQLPEGLAYRDDGLGFSV